MGRGGGGGGFNSRLCRSGKLFLGRIVTGLREISLVGTLRVSAASVPRRWKNLASGTKREAMVAGLVSVSLLSRGLWLIGGILDPSVCVLPSTLVSVFLITGVSSDLCVPFPNPFAGKKEGGESVITWVSPGS